MELMPVHHAPPAIVMLTCHFDVAPASEPDVPTSGVTLTASRQLQWCATLWGGGLCAVPHPQPTTKLEGHYTPFPLHYLTIQTWGGITVAVTHRQVQSPYHQLPAVTWWVQVYIQL